MEIGRGTAMTLEGRAISVAAESEPIWVRVELREGALGQLGLDPLPEPDREQITVHGHEPLPDLGGNLPREGHEGRELLGEHVPVADREPRLGAHFVLRLVGIGYHPEPALLQQGQLVVVVEHDGPVAGHPEVLGEQVARPNVGGGQILDGPAPVDGRGLGPVGLHFLQVQVQRVHLAFGIGVTDHYLVAGQLDRLSRLVEQFLEQVRVEALGRRHSMDIVTRMESIAQGFDIGDVGQNA